MTAILRVHSTVSLARQLGGRGRGRCTHLGRSISVEAPALRSWSTSETSCRRFVEYAVPEMPSAVMFRAWEVQGKEEENVEAIEVRARGKLGERERSDALMSDDFPPVHR